VTAPDVIIVGAGPAGSALGGLLARQGVRVALLDRARFPRPKPCGECLNPGAVAALHRLGLWEAAGPLDPVPLRGWRFQGCDLDFPAGQQALAVDRSRLDHALLGWAAAGGAEVAEGVRVTDLLLSDGRVAGVRAGCAYPAKFVVGADGLRSVVMRRLGLLQRSRRVPRVAITAHWQGVTGLTDRGEIHVRDRAVCGIAPLGGDYANVVLVVDAPAARGLDQAAALARWPGLAQRFAGARPSGRPLATGPFDQPVRAVTAPGALLAGDAAGYFDPLTGQGIYRALRSAELAAPAVLAALAGGEAAALAEYQRRLRAEFDPAVRRQRLVDGVIRRPLALGAATRLLAALPGAGRRLLALLGDCPS
jgi:flavin-dependent dehydrogenase